MENREPNCNEMESTEMEKTELNTNEMENISGGRTDATTVVQIMKVNKELKNPDFIRS